MKWPVTERIGKKIRLDKFKLLVNCPWHFTVKHLVTNKKIEKISPSAYCITKKMRILIEKEKFIYLYNAVISVASLVPYTPYVRRYMTLYKSYESLTKNIPIEFRAVRNGISHSSTALCNRTTVNTLEKLFGTKHIDFNKQKHVDIFYEIFSQMFIAHDKVLYKHLMKEKNSFRILRMSDEIATSWQIENNFI